MTESHSLLCVGLAKEEAWRRAAAGLGLDVVHVRPELERALATLRTGTFRGILVHGEPGSLDLIEFVLNVRDLDANVPILIADVGGRRRTDLLPQRLLHHERDTHVLGAADTPELASRMGELLRLGQPSRQGD